MSTNERLPRTLLPKADATNPQRSAPVFDEMNDADDATLSKSVRSSAQIRSNIRSACLACRQRRSKCTGGAPCNRCLNLGTECVYEVGQDRRTRAIRERGKEELELHKKVLDGLFKAIRDGDDKSLMALVRQNASLQDLAALIDNEGSSDDNHQATRPDHTLPSNAPSDHGKGKRSHSTSDSQDDLLMHNQSHYLRSPNDQDSSTDEYTVQNSANSTDPEREWSLSSSSNQATVMQDRRDVTFRHLLAPLHSSSITGLDSISQFCLQFRETGSHMIRQGFPQEIVLGYSDVRCDLVFRARQESDPFNIYTWAAAVVNRYPDLDLFFRLSWLVLMVRFMRWSVVMTEANFEQLPELIKPTSMQVSIPHTPFVDLAPLPQLRDALIDKPRDYCAAFQLSGVSTSWQRPLQDAVIHDPVSGSMTISREFENHISNPDHFLFGQAILSVFPELAGKIQTVPDDFIPATTLLPSVIDTVSTTTSPIS